jgi:hypothetical protein
MDPVTVLMGALSAVGAAIGEQAIKDGYEGLKAFVVRKFGGGHPRLAERLDDYVQDPATFARPAEKALRESGAALDQDVVDRVLKLLEQVSAVRPVPPSLVGELKAVRSNVAIVGGDVHGGLTFGAPPAARD